MTIRLRSISGDEMRIRPQLKIQPVAYEGGLGPYMPDIGALGSGPTPSTTILDRSNATVYDRAGSAIQTRA